MERMSQTMIDIFRSVFELGEDSCFDFPNEDKEQVTQLDRSVLQVSDLVKSNLYSALRSVGCVHYADDNTKEVCDAVFDYYLPFSHNPMKDWLSWLKKGIKQYPCKLGDIIEKMESGDDMIWVVMNCGEVEIY